MKITFYFLTVLTIFSISSCAINKIKPDTIERVYIDYNENQNINFGAKLGGTVMAILKNGEERDITFDNHLKIVSNNLSFSGSEMSIAGRPIECGNDTLKASFIYQYKEKRADFKDHVILNYQGPLIIDESGKDGLDYGKNRMLIGKKILGRDGRDGKDGEDGGNGEHGRNFIVHLWKDSNVFNVRMMTLDSTMVWCYKSMNSVECSIDVSGGNGGNGGKASNGGSGKNGTISESKNKSPGDGGDGGDGGNGGNGGNAGSLIVIIHPNVSEALDKLNVENLFGVAGSGGKKGSAGAGGSGAEGQWDGVDGVPGLPGVSGIPGNDAPFPTIKTEEFDFSQF